MHAVYRVDRIRRTIIYFKQQACSAAVGFLAIASLTEAAIT
jgi:hypothetical protein